MHIKHLRGTHYLVVWGALVALTLISLGASFLLRGGQDVWIALAIAVVKSALVLLFFMHLVEERFANGLVVIVALILIATLVALTTADPATRFTFPPATIPPPQVLE